MATHSPLRIGFDGPGKDSALVYHGEITGPAQGQKAIVNQSIW